MKDDVVIIGGGLAGLASAALIAKDGRRVTVLEKGNRPGGRAYTYEDRGFTLNYGPHAMYRPDSGLLGDVLRRLGRPRLPYGIPDPLRSYWSDGDRFGSIGGRPQDLLTTSLLPLPSRLRLVPLMAALRLTKPESAGDRTFGAWLDEHTSDDALRRFTLALVTVNTYARPAADLSAEFVLRHVQRNLFARDYVGYLSGGWRSIYDTFIVALQEHGGALVTGAGVERLETGESGRVVAAVASGRRYEAAAFVCTLPPQEAPALAPAGTPLAGELARWSDLEDVRALCIDLGFDRRLRTDLTLVYDIERDLYFSLHSEVTPDLAPEGAQLLHAMAYLSPEEAAGRAELPRRKDELTAGLDRFFPGWREAAVVQRTIERGLITSVRRTPGQVGRRVPLRAQAAPNLYFAGDGRDLPYNLSEVSLASALEVAHAVASGAPAGARTEAITASR